MFGTSLNPHRDIKTAHCHGVIWFKDSILLQKFFNFSLDVVVNLWMFPFALSVSLMFLILTWRKMFWSSQAKALWALFCHCRFQPPPAVVLHDLLHHPACTPRLAWHERVQEEVRLGVGRVLQNCPLPDHPPRLLRKSTLDTQSWGHFFVCFKPSINSCVKAPKIWMDWPIWPFVLFIFLIA